MILTKECANFLLPFLQAYAEGKVVKGRHRCNEGWETLDEHSRWESYCELKIVNLPREFCIEINKSGSPLRVHFGGDAEAEFSDTTLIKVREITE